MGGGFEAIGVFFVGAGVWAVLSGQRRAFGSIENLHKVPEAFFVNRL
jgi:hypothetical protein